MNDSHIVQNLVSVIVPVYMVELYIQECVISIVNQTYPNIEILFIDDASCDKSIELAKEILSKSKRNWRILSHNNNKGVSIARNNGILNANGEYLFFVDSDDFLAIDCIEKQVEVINKYKADMVFANQYDIIDGIITQSCRILDNDIFSDNPLDSHIRGKTTSMVWNRLIRKDFYTRCKISFIEGIRCEDELWSFSLIIRAKRIAFLNEYSYYYRRWEGSFTRNKNNEIYKIKCLYKNILHHYDEAKKYNLFTNSEFRIWIARKTLYFLTELMQSNIETKHKKEYLDKIFKNIPLPYPEFNKSTLYIFWICEKLFFSNSQYYGAKLISILCHAKKAFRKIGCWHLFRTKKSNLYIPNR